MRKVIVHILFSLFIVSIFTSSVDAAKCTVVNNKTSKVRVAYSTWMEATGKYPEGYRVKGWVYIQPLKKRTFSSKYDLYVRVEDDAVHGQALKPAGSTKREDYEFHLNPGSGSFTTVESSNGEILYSSVNDSELVTMGGFYEFTQDGTFSLKGSISDQITLQDAVATHSNRYGGFCRSSDKISQKLTIIDETNDSNAAKTKGVASKYAIWTPNDTVVTSDTYNNLIITVRFLNGTDEEKEIVRTVAPKWSKYGGFRFRFIDNNGRSDIRITFKPVKTIWDEELQSNIPIGVFKSVIGTDAMYIKQSLPTMHLCFTGTENYAEMQGTILHEFGHALGLLHEHQHPAVQINWNKPLVKKIMKGQGWTEQDVNEQIFNPLEESKHFCTKYDPDSIMLYHYPSDWTLDGKGTSINEDLSIGDQQIISKLYSGEIRDKRIPFSFSGKDWKKLLIGGYEPIEEFFNPPNGVILDVTVHTTKKKRAVVNSAMLRGGRIVFDASIEKGAIYQYGELEGYINIIYVPFDP